MIRTIFVAVAVFLGLVDRISAQWPTLAYDGTQLEPALRGTAPVVALEQMRLLAFPNATIDSVAVDPADGSCRVRATITHPPAGDRITVWIALPMRAWNGRFCGTGGGGFVSGRPEALREPVKFGFAAAATDAGFAGARSALGPDGKIDWPRVRDFSYLGIHEMTVIGKAVTKAFYGKAPRYAYFVSSSTGGRQGLVEAQRYPSDYDGILVGCPAINWTHMVISCIWPQVVMSESKDFPSGAKLAAAVSGAVRACGGTGHYLADPGSCTWDPGRLVGSQVGGETFTEADAAVVRRIWEGPRGLDGRFLWYGRLRGADLTALAHTEGIPRRGKPMSIPVDWIRYFLVRRPDWDWQTLNYRQFEQLLDQAVGEFGDVFRDDNPDLARFRDHGGKLIVLHGLADQLIPPQGTVQYFEHLQSQMGGADRTAQFARLFLVSGLDHSFQGPGPKPALLLTSLTDWVEGGQAPDRLRAIPAGKKGEAEASTFLYPWH